MLLHDLQRALRGLLRTPFLAATLLLTLGIGIGAATASVSALSTLLLHPLPQPGAERLLALWSTHSKGERRGVSLLDLRDWQEQSSSFEALAAGRRRSFALTAAEGETPTHVVQAGMVTADLFGVLAVAPVHGRFFGTREEIEEAPVIVLGEEIWRRLWNGDPEVVGHRVWLNEEPRTVVGILPAGMALPLGGEIPEVYVPLSSKMYGQSRSARTLEAVARLRTAVDAATARRELEAVAERLEAAYPDTNHEAEIDLESLHEALRGHNRQPLLLLLGASALLLGIACVNVAQLLSVRALDASRSTAIRLALGAGHRDLAGRFLLEAGLLAIAGTGLGLACAQLVLEILPHLLPILGGGLPEALPDLRLDATAFRVAALLACVCTLVFGLLPLLLTRRLDLSRLVHTAVDPKSLHGRLRAASVVAQVALSTVLLLAAGLLLRSLLVLLAVEPGFQADDVVSFGIGLPAARYETEPKQIGFFLRAEERLGEIPGVEAVGFAARRPLTGSSYNTSFQTAEEPLPKDERPRVAVNVVSPGYFETLRIPLLEGRVFDWRDDLETPRVLLVNQALAEAYLANASSTAGSTVGRRLQLSWWSELNPRQTWWEVAGVVGDVRERELEKAAAPRIYLPLGQFPADGGTFVVRREAGAVLGPEHGAGLLQAAMDGLDGSLQRLQVRPFEMLVRDHTAERRLGVLASLVLAGLAVVLSALGLHGALTLGVARRRRELAIRRSLGATAARIRRLVMGWSARLVTTGAVGGMGIFFAVERLMRHQLFGITAWDPASAIAVAGVLSLVTLAAAGPAAHRAVRAAPWEHLREE